MTSTGNMRRIVISAALMTALGLGAPTTAVAAPHDAAYEAAAERIAAGIERSLIEQEAHRVVTGSGRVLSIVDPGDVETSVDTLSTLPTSYTAPYTSVKNQGITNSCWAYAAIGALESSWMAVNGIAGERSDAIDLSEAQLVYTAFNGETVDGTLAGALSGASDNDHYIATEGCYGFLNGLNSTAASARMFTRRGIVYESDNPTFLTQSLEELPSLATTVAERAAASWSLNRIAIDCAYKMSDLAPTVSFDGVTIDREWSAASLQTIKEAIYSTGGVTAGIYFCPVDNPRYCHNAPGYVQPDDTYQMLPENIWVYDTDVAEMYPEGEGGATANHDLVYVGWDDAYSRWNFATPLIDDEGNERLYDPKIAEVARGEDGQDYIVPIGDGAWVAKNSWGEDIHYSDGLVTYIGDNGVFHVSYYEKTMDTPTAIVPFAADEQPVDEVVHQYDGPCSVVEYSEDDKDVFAANVFAAEQDERITSVGVYLSPSTELTVSVYTGLSDPTEPESGVLAATATATFDESGFYTIDLEDAPHVDAGEVFSVVLCGHFPNDQGEKTRSGVRMESDADGLGTSYSQRGESLIRIEAADDPGIWIDVADLPESEVYGIGNNAIKAFAEPVEDASEDEGGDVDDPGEDAGDSGDPEGGSRPENDEPANGTEGNDGDRGASPVTGELAATGDTQDSAIAAAAALSVVALAGAAALRSRPR